MRFAVDCIKAIRRAGFGPFPAVAINRNETLRIRCLVWLLTRETIIKENIAQRGV